MTVGPAYQLIDGDVWVGRSSSPDVPGAGACSPSDLLAEMDRLGVAEATVFHVLAREYAPAAGNAMLREALRAHPRLHPVWVVLPHHTGEFRAPATLVPRLRDAGVRLVRMFPTTGLTGQRFALREWCVGALLAALEEAGIPLIIDFCLPRRGEPPWDDIYEICSRHPGLPVLLPGIQGRNNRSLYPLLERLPRLLVHTAGLNVHRGLEDIVARFGANRLVYGSGYPVHSMGAARLQLERAELDDRDKALIGAGSLGALLGARWAEAVGRGAS